MVSLGPGDYELITVKALKALKNSDAICVPTKSPDHSFTRSMTYKIIQKLMEEFEFDKPIIGFVKSDKYNESQSKEKEIAEIKEQQMALIEKISGLTAEEAKTILLKDVENQTKHEAAMMVKEIEQEAKENAEKKAKNIKRYARNNQAYPNLI